MKRYLVKVKEITIHCITVLADDHHHARTKALAFDYTDDEHLIPEFQCRMVRRPSGECEAENTTTPKRFSRTSRMPSRLEV